MRAVWRTWRRWLITHHPQLAVLRFDVMAPVLVAWAALLLGYAWLQPISQSQVPIVDGVVNLAGFFCVCVSIAWVVLVVRAAAKAPEVLDDSWSLRVSVLLGSVCLMGSVFAYEYVLTARMSDFFVSSELSATMQGCLPSSQVPDCQELRSLVPNFYQDPTLDRLLKAEKEVRALRSTPGVLDPDATDASRAKLYAAEAELHDAQRKADSGAVAAMGVLLSAARRHGLRLPASFNFLTGERYSSNTPVVEVVVAARVRNGRTFFFLFVPIVAAIVLLAREEGVWVAVHAPLASAAGFGLGLFSSELLFRPIAPARTDYSSISTKQFAFHCAYFLVVGLPLIYSAVTRRRARQLSSARWSISWLLCLVPAGAMFCDLGPERQEQFVMQLCVLSSIAVLLIHAWLVHARRLPVA